jgi:hypothetical protein
MAAPNRSGACITADNPHNVLKRVETCYAFKSTADSLPVLRSDWTS